MIISHDLAGIGFSCHRVILMGEDAIVEEEGDVEDILAAPEHCYTKELIAAMPGAAPGRGRRAGRCPRAAASTREECSPCG